jgi:hypothetical protein
VKDKVEGGRRNQERGKPRKESNNFSLPSSPPSTHTSALRLFKDPRRRLPPLAPR